MARKTFISYKYSEATDLRDVILKKLGEDSKYYQGETAESPDLNNTSVENIRKNLKDMMFDTSVTIVIISPNFKQSKWIDWEIEYSLKEVVREDKTSRTNGIVGIIMKFSGGYDWLISQTTNSDGCKPRTIDDSKLYNIIIKNRLNLDTENKYSCPICKTFDQLNGSYISLIEEEKFLADPNKFIENANDKSKKIGDYDISKER
jgi:hypothetical protein